MVFFGSKGTNKIKSLLCCCLLAFRPMFMPRPPTYSRFALLAPCKRLTQGTDSTIPQTVVSRTALQLDQETSLLAGCQRVAHQLARGWTLAFPRSYTSNSPKASSQDISGLFTRYDLYSMGFLQNICASFLRADISVDKWGTLSTCSLVTISYCNNYTIDRTFCQTRSIFDIHHSSYPYSGADDISNCSHILW